MADDVINPQDVEDMLRKMKEAMEEYTNTVKESFTTIGKEYTDLIRKSMKELAKEQALREWFTTVGETIGAGIAESMQKSLQRSLPAGLSQLEPGLGKFGEAAGSAIVGGLVLAFTGNPALAKLGQQFGSSLTKAVSMQLEGYQMIGARVAPEAFGGFQMPTNFDQLGRNYRQMIMELGKTTGASADQIGKVITQLSRVGIGFEEGSREAAQYALAAERAMNLNQGMITNLQLDVVEQYGQSIDAATRSVETYRSVQREMLALYHQSDNQMHKTMATGQILSSTFEQMRSGALQSGASIDALNSAVAIFYKQMASGGKEGAPMYRPQMMGTLGERTVAGLFPLLTGTPEEEMQRSQTEWWFTKQTGIGRSALADMGVNAKEFMGDPSKLLMLNLRQVQMLQDPAMQEKWTQLYFAKMAGISEVYEQQGAAAAITEAGKLGFMPASVDLIHRTMKTLQAKGLSTEQWTEENARIARQWMTEEQLTPQEKELMDKSGLTRSVLDIAREQGEAQRSVMDKVADELTTISTHMNEYWGNFKRTVRDALGLDTKELPPSIVEQQQMLHSLGMPVPTAQQRTTQQQMAQSLGMPITEQPEYPHLETDIQIISQDTLVGMRDGYMRMDGTSMVGANR